MTTQECTLAVITKDGKILLQKKAAGHFGADKWNGAGGKFEPNETAQQCMERELSEELKIKATGMCLVAILRFYKEDPERPYTKQNLHVSPIIKCYVYQITSYEGIPQPSDEGEIRWFPLDQIPYDQMWADDKYWLPLINVNEMLSGSFYFDSELKELKSYGITKWSDLFVTLS